MNTFLVLHIFYFCIKKSSCPKTKNDSKKSNESYEKMISDMTLKDDDIELLPYSHLKCEKRQELYVLMANAENMLYMRYLEIYKQPQDMHDLFLYNDLTDHWRELKALEKKFPTKKDKKSQEFADEEEKEYIRKRKFVEKVTNPYPPTSLFMINYDLKESSETLYKYKEEFKDIWGIPETVNLKEKEFFEKYYPENIFWELKDEVQLRAKLDSYVPNVNDVKELVLELKRYSTRYDKECSVNDFIGIDLLYKQMYEHIVYIVKTDNSRNYIHFLFCGQAYFDATMQIKCRKAKKAFPLLTLSQFIYIAGRIDM